MPMYSYKCSATGAVFDRVQSMKETGTEVECNCGAIAKKVYHAPMAWVETDCPPHKAPRTGEMITTNKQRREFMAKNSLIDAGDFTPDFVFRESAERKRKLNEEAAKAYADLPDGLTPEKVLDEVLHD